MNRFFGARYVRLDRFCDLPVKLRYCLAARLFECRPNFRVDLLEVRFGTALHFFAVRAHYIFELRLESGQRLLLFVFKLRRMLFQPLAGFSGTVSRSPAICCSASVAALVADSRAAVA